MGKIHFKRHKAHFFLVWGFERPRKRSSLHLTFYGWNRPLHSRIQFTMTVVNNLFTFPSKTWNSATFSALNWFSDLLWYIIHVMNKYLRYLGKGKIVGKIVKKKYFRLALNFSQDWLGWYIPYSVPSLPTCRCRTVLTYYRLVSIGLDRLRCMCLRSAHNKIEFNMKKQNKKLGIDKQLNYFDNLNPNSLYHSSVRIR